MTTRRSPLRIAALLVVVAASAFAEEAPKPLEFPPHHSDRRISGELVGVDFIRRRGQFRMSKTGELVDFTMPPYGAVNYLNAEADLRDVPLGTFCLFFLHQDARGEFTRLVAMQDQCTMDAGHSFSYWLDKEKLSEGKLLTAKQSLPKIPRHQPAVSEAMKQSTTAP